MFFLKMARVMKRVMNDSGMTPTPMSMLASHSSPAECSSCQRAGVASDYTCLTSIADVLGQAHAHPHKRCAGSRHMQASPLNG